MGLTPNGHRIETPLLVSLTINTFLVNQELQQYLVSSPSPPQKGCQMGCCRERHHRCCPHQSSALSQEEWTLVTNKHISYFLPSAVCSSVRLSTTCRVNIGLGWVYPSPFLEQLMRYNNNTSSIPESESVEGEIRSFT